MRARSIAVTVAVVTLAATACSNSSSGKAKDKNATTSTVSARSPSSGRFPAVDQPGVTPTEIRVSGIASATNPTAVDYASSFNGVQAYFDMVNSRGGIYGRKLVLASRHDDQTTSNQREVEAVLSQEHPFAVLPLATILFTGAPLLAKAGMPTFGWNIQDEWTGPPSFFGQTGALCNGGDCANPGLPWVAGQVHRKRAAVIAYNVPQATQCADQVNASFAKYPTAKVVFTDKSLSFGVTDMSADVKRMVDRKVDFVTTCIDQNGSLTLAREMRQQGLPAIMYLVNAYDHDFMSRYGGFFEGAVVLVQESPLETRPQPPALLEFVKWMDRSHAKKTENAEIGWVNADQFVTGLRAAGPDFSQQKLVDAINRETAYDAGGLVAPIDWTHQHTERHYPRTCGAYVRVEHGRFVTAFSPSGRPFVCFTDRPDRLADAKIEYLP